MDRLVPAVGRDISAGKLANARARGVRSGALVVGMRTGPPSAVGASKRLHKFTSEPSFVVRSTRHTVQSSFHGISLKISDGCTNKVTHFFNPGAGETPFGCARFLRLGRQDEPALRRQRQQQRQRRPPEGGRYEGEFLIDTAAFRLRSLVSTTRHAETPETHLWLRPPPFHRANHMHVSPVKRKLVENPRDWPSSGFNFCQGRGEIVIGIDPAE
jgi:hypothetical protein